MIRNVLEWIGNTSWSIQLLESYWVWPLVESTHVLSLGLFVGTAAMMDLRLLGISFKTVDVAEFTGKMLFWTRAGFTLMTITGLLLFYSAPLRYYHNIFFRVKVVLLVIAGFNIWWFHSRIHRSISEWGGDSVPPRSARLAGAVSLLTWAFIVVAGRLIAYNWFDCDIQPQSDLVNWAAGCVLSGE